LRHGLAERNSVISTVNRRQTGFARVDGAPGGARAMSNRAYRDKVCIVTGGASGLGREIGRQLAASGARVALADVDEAGLAEAVAEIARNGGEAKAAAVDVTDAESVRRLAEETASEFGRIDYLFNNAGVAVVGEIRDLSLEQWRLVIEVNLFGEINGVHYVYPIMIRQGFGHIVNIASGFGMAPGPLATPYVASKCAIFGLSQALAAEARAFGVAVSVACPGFIATPLVAGMKPVNADPKDVARRIKLEPTPVERAARLILARVARKRLIIVFPGYVHVLIFLHRFFPALFVRLGSREVERFRRFRKAPSGDRA
jgi:NAD(P)-dependent dehydrogenase (short-subunit alcohol dehydrogenase family)